MTEVKRPKCGVAVHCIYYISCALETDLAMRYIKFSDLIRMDKIR